MRILQRISGVALRLPVLCGFALTQAAEGVIRLFKEANSIRYLRTARRYPIFIREGNASAFCIEHAKLYCSGKGVDVGAGAWPYPGARLVELSDIENAYSLNEDDGALDYVFSSHCLEHLDAWETALAEWNRVLRDGGIMYLYLPHPAADLWNAEVLKYHEWNPSPHELSEYLKTRGHQIIDISYFPDAYLSFYIVAKKTAIE